MKKSALTDEEHEVDRRKQVRHMIADLKTRWMVLRLAGKERSKVLKQVNQKFARGAVRTRKRLMQPPGKRKTGDGDGDGLAG